MEKELNPKIFYIYGGAILVFKGIFFQHLNQNICPPVDLTQRWPILEALTCSPSTLLVSRDRQSMR
jgi:hypothetical protein